MRRFICSVLLAVLIIGILPVSALADDADIIYLSDGSYMVARLYEHGTRAAGTVSGGKEYTHYDSDGSANWKAVLSGTFAYTGSSSSCTASNMNVTIYDSSWYTVSKSASKSGNTATGSVIMGDTANGVTVKRVPVSLTLTCDANGNLS